MVRAFSIGDKVRVKKANNRTSKVLLGGLRLDHPRTITATYYDPQTQHTRYYLGSNKRGVDLSYVYFRASELCLWRKGRIGRPRVKRHYKKHLVKPQGVTPIEYTQQKGVYNA